MADLPTNEKFSYLYAFPDPFQTLNFSLKSLEECLANSLIVLDANVLLHPFKTGPHALDEIEKSLTRLKDERRLFVPEHALREYIANRPTKIKEFYDQLNKQRNKDYSLPSVAKLIEKVASYPELLEAEKRLKDEIENYRNTIALAIDEVRKWTTNDPVSKMYQRVLSPDIIVSLTEDIPSLDREHKDRNSKAIPPGYKDSGKGQNSIGDFIIWRTILEIGKKNPSSNLVFVSGEEKPDWVYRGSTEVLYAREELIEEYRQASNGGTFHLIDFATLLRYLKASDKAVAEVAFTEANTTMSIATEVDIEEAPAVTLRWSEFVNVAKAAVGKWLESVTGEQNVYREEEGSAIDYIAFLPGPDIEYLVQVKAIRDYKTFSKTVRDATRYLSIQIANRPSRGNVEDIDAVIVFVCESKNGAYYIEEAKHSIELPDWLSVRAGYLENGEFLPVSKSM